MTTKKPSTATGRRKTAKVRAPGAPLTQRAFPCCPVCSHRVTPAWLRREGAVSRRWGYVMEYRGRRQSRKVRDVLVWATPPVEIQGLMGEFADLLAGRVAAVLADMGDAGWNLEYLVSLARYLQNRNFFALLGAELVTQRTVIGPVEPDVTLGDQRVVSVDFARAEPVEETPARRVVGVVRPQITMGAARTAGGLGR